jgi:hypothetical protein
MSADLVHRVERACHDLRAAGQPITFPNVAAHAGTGRTTLYRHPELRAIVEEHRQSLRDALTLTGLAIQIAQLRATSKPSPARYAATKNNSASSTGGGNSQPTQHIHALRLAG